MAGQIRLFTKNPRGLLAEVAPEDAEALRASRSCSRVSLVIDVLWTEEEEASRAAEIAAAEAARQAEAEAEAARLAAIEELRKGTLKKLERLGITPEELASLIK